MDRELVEVEGPFVEQVVGLGWTHVTGSKWAPAASERTSFREVLLVERLRAALHRINLDDDGKPWLDDEHVSQAVSTLSTAPAGEKLIEANQQATELLLTGVTVAGVEGWDGGRDRTIDYIDWDHPERNDFVVVTQFRVDEPGGQARRFVVPDLVLFVNGIPLVVVECKAPGPEDAMAVAIGQLRRYANQRPEVEQAEGNEQLFWTNQVVVATTGERARAGTFTSGPEHFLEWKDTAPADRAEVAAGLGKAPDDLTGQELLVAGMLRPATLLDLVRHFTVFMEAGGRTVKVVARYQQYRGVVRAVQRLRTGATRAQDGEIDRRGGLIWHTQGSGKSLTMVFLVRVLRSDPALRRTKVVVVTDRKDLQRQLTATAALAGETVLVGTSTAKVQELLARPGPALVMAMIQKYRDTGPSGDGDAEVFPVLNEDEAIVVLVDEAHRSHGSALHANLLGALPNAARIGFTGTPIIMGAKQKTHDIFGPFLDRYTLSESEADGSTVPILYEGRTTQGAVRGASSLDEVFFEWFAGLDDSDRDALQRKYASVAEVLEAPELIAAKAGDMLRHYVATVMPQRFKAMVVATSRLACVRYRDAFLAARADLLDELDALDPAVAALTDAIEDLPAEQQFMVRALPHLDLLRELDFVPVISGDHNDDPAWSAWTDESRQRVNVDQFTKPLGTVAGGGDPTGFVIVQRMLLTGFDVPVAQVLYLDRLIREAELLQAIARVNRTADGKDYGLVVDYYGVAAHLTEALAAYSSDVIDGALRSLGDEIERLGARHQRVRQLFLQRGVEPDSTAEAMEACVELLADEPVRAQFDVDLKRFLTSLDIVLPRPEARPFVADAKRFADLQRRVRQRYRDQDDGGFDPSLYRQKVRQLVDEHVTVLDLSQRIPPVRITDLDFVAKLAGLPSARAKASEMEHAARHHIRVHLDEDPARYQRLSERLDEILQRIDLRWDQLVLELDGFVAELAAPPRDDGTGLDPATEGPFHGILAQSLPDADAAQAAHLVALTKEIVGHVRAEVVTVGFWSNDFRQDQLRRWVKLRLDTTDLWTLATCDALAAQLVELARANHHRLVPA